VQIVALRTEYIVHERYINATGCLNIILQIGFLPDDGDRAQSPKPNHHHHCYI
jgi:hypothetical protein